MDIQVQLVDVVITVSQLWFSNLCPWREGQCGEEGGKQYKAYMYYMISVEVIKLMVCDKLLWLRNKNHNNS